MILNITIVPFLKKLQKFITKLLCQYNDANKFVIDKCCCQLQTAKTVANAFFIEETFALIK